jgi:hypothetical protein
MVAQMNLKWLLSVWLDAIVEGQIAGLEWLDSVDHLLEKDEDGSRTQAYSGLEMDAPHSFQVKD